MLVWQNKYAFLVWKEQLRQCTKHFLLCSTDESKSYLFGTTWSYVNDDKLFFFIYLQWKTPVFKMPFSWPLHLIALSFLIRYTVLVHGICLNPCSTNNSVYFVVSKCYLVLNPLYNILTVFNAVAALGRHQRPLNWVAWKCLCYLHTNYCMLCLFMERQSTESTRCSYLVFLCETASESVFHSIFP